MFKLLMEFETQDDLDMWLGAYYDGGGEQTMDETWQQDNLESPKINITEVKADTVTIDQSEYNVLFEESKLLRALEAAGVDNWEGYDIAQDILNEGKE